MLDESSTLLLLLAAVASASSLLALAAAHEILRPFARSFRELCVLALRVSSAATRAVLLFVFSRGGSARFPRWTLAYEWFQAIAFAAGERHGAHILKPGNARVFRRNFDAIGWLLGVVSCWMHGTSIQSFERLGLRHLWLRSVTSSWPLDVLLSLVRRRQPNASPKRTLTILYYHGGGYALFSPQFFVDFCNRLRSQVVTSLASKQGSSDNVQVLLANYRKLPECAFPAPLDDAMAMYDYLTIEKEISPKDIVLAGDSAGGGLVLGTLLRLRDDGRELPLAAVCNCPYVDLAADIEVAPHCFISKSMLDAIRESAIAEPTGAWQEGVMLDRDLTGLPALLIQAAEFDILHPQSLRLAKLAERDGVDVKLDVHRYMPHVFTLFPPIMLPHASVGVQRMGEFIAAQRLKANDIGEDPSVVTVADGCCQPPTNERIPSLDRLLPPAA